MAYITKDYLVTQFTNFATRVSTVFAKKDELPSKTSDLTNDSNFVSDANYTHTDNNYTTADKTKVENAVLTSVQTLTDQQKAQARANIGAGASSFSGDYNDLVNTPTALSDFDNDEDFITNTVDNLVNYYKKTETYTQEQVNTLISNIVTFGVSIVEQLPTTNISTHTIYLVLKESSKQEEGNIYNEYLNTNGTTTGWELIGDTKITIDLSAYLTAQQIAETYATIASLADYLKTTDVETTNIDFSNYFSS